jgi:hypothetical protein
VQAWEKNPLQNAPNVHRVMKWFDSVNLFVFSFVLARSDVKKRVRALGKVIEIVEVLLSLCLYPFLLAVSRQAPKFQRCG